MLSLFRKQINSQLFRRTRCLSQLATLSDASTSSTLRPKPLQYPYFVPRNTRGNLPVYTDVRNAGGRYLVLIRNVEGNVSALARDLTESLLGQDSPEALHLKVQINQSKHLVISGGRWRDNVVEWLKARGF